MEDEKGGTSVRMGSERPVYTVDARPFSSHMRIISWIGQDKKVLDLGCGTGKIPEPMIHNGCKVIGIEIDQEMAELARGRGIEVTIVDVENNEARRRRAKRM